MTNEPIDPVYKYVDNQIKLINRKIQQLTVAHDAIANQHAREILDLQRMVAISKINNDADTFSAIIESHQFRTKNSVRTQLLAEASSVKAQIITSKNPIDIASEYHNKWNKTLRDLGLDFINF